MQNPFTTSLLEVSNTLSINPKTIKYFINGDLGTRWIIDKKLSISEVQLAMFVKTIRKRLAIEFNNTGELGIKQSESSKRRMLSLVKDKYEKFYILHKDFYKFRKSLKKIKDLLHEDILVFEGGISTENFFKILPDVLSKISPEELEMSYVINTLFRQSLASLLGKKMGIDLYARGSLLFFNSHSFGNGYLANFVHQKDSRNMPNTYYPLQGSDLDVKYVVSEKILHKYEIKIEQYRKEVNSDFKKFNNFLTIELDILEAKSKDSVWKINDIGTLQSIFLTPVLLQRFRQVNEHKYIDNRDISLQKKYLFQKFRESGKFKKIQKKRVILGEEGVGLFTAAFNLALKDLGVNKSLRKQFCKKWEEKLYAALMETDFYGCIEKKELFFAFKSLFLFSGYRFSDKEEKVIFKSILDNYADFGLKNRQK